jgi:hypothetical protein
LLFARWNCQNYLQAFCPPVHCRLQLPEGEPRPWLFVAHQKRLSLLQMGIYSEHAAAAEETDEDFFGNFS